MWRALIPTLALCLALGAQDLEQAGAAYQHTDYDAALRLLQKAPASAEVHALRGQALYGKGDYRAASEELEKAAAAAPGNSIYWHWLGRAYGRRAETSSFLTAPRWASRCRGAFEKAVELDPRNLDAASDLFSYYMEAPGILGGGVDKAAALAAKIRPLSEAQYEYSRAELAQRRHEWPEAERHLRRAAELEPGQAGRLVDLARFLAARGRHAESDRVFQQALELAPPGPAVKYERAAVLIEHKRQLPEARKLLTEYLQADLTPEDPSRRDARHLLEKAGG